MRNLAFGNYACVLFEWVYSLPFIGMTMSLGTATVFVTWWHTWPPRNRCDLSALFDTWPTIFSSGWIFAPHAWKEIMLNLKTNVIFIWKRSVLFVWGLKMDVDFKKAFLSAKNLWWNKVLFVRNEWKLLSLFHLELVTCLSTHSKIVNVHLKEASVLIGFSWRLIAMALGLWLFGLQLKSDIFHLFNVCLFKHSQIRREGLNIIRTQVVTADSFEHVRAFCED